MIRFEATILRFEENADKTGWSYLPVPAALAQELLPGNKKAFRVKGSLDTFPIKGVSLLPAGGGDFILPFNAGMRKGTGKREGATIVVAIMTDTTGLELPEDLLAGLAEDPAAQVYFFALPPSHQRYWVNWLNSVKTAASRQSRLARAVVALSRGQGFAEMLRAEKAARL